MLDETKVVETNFKGNISLSNELIEKVIFIIIYNISEFIISVVAVFESSVDSEGSKTTW